MNTINRKDEKEVCAYLGIDWGDKEHSISRLDVETGQLVMEKLTQSAEAIDEYFIGLKRQYGDGQIAVILEQKHGALIFALTKYDNLIIYPINPRTSARYREALYPSGAKDDPTDGQLLLEFITRHIDKCTPWNPDTEAVRKVQILTEQRRKIVNEITRLTNRLTSELKLYFPQALELVSRLDTKIAAELLMAYPTLEAIKNESDETLVDFFRKHGSRSMGKIDKKILIIRESIPLTKDRAVIDSYSTVVKAQALQIIPLISAVKTIEDKIEETCACIDECRIFESFPHAGSAFSARLLAAFGTDRSRFADADEFLRFSGIAPVIRRSGNTSITSMRRACPIFVRQTLIEYAFLSLRSSTWAKAFYARKRAEGKRHYIALRALAFKWARIMFSCWKNGSLYCESLYAR